MPKRAFAAVLLTTLFCFTSRAQGTLDIYFIDVGRSVGNATLLVTPTGQSMLLDAGPAYAAQRVLAVLKQAGVQQLDYLVITHFHADHYGAMTKIASEMPILHFIDHGPSVEAGKDDPWWKQRRGPWFRPNMGKEYDKNYHAYLDALPKDRHTTVHPGDTIPIAGAQVVVLCSAGKVLTSPLPGAGQPNPACAGADRRADDDAEDAQSIGVRVSLNSFHFVYLGDLTWNLATDLFCPNNLVGSADAYLITHHAQSMPKEMGDYYYGLSACPKAEVHGLRPRVAFLSLGALGHKQGTSEAMDNVHSSPGLEDIWQTEFIESGGEKQHNAPKELIANIGDNNQSPARYIKLSAHPDGSFDVTNSRTNFTRHYAARKQ